MTREVLIMAGGTGGHVFPALAVAHELGRRGFSVQWLGTEQGIESRLVPQHGYRLNTLPVRGLRGNGLARLAGAPLMLARAVFSAWRLIRRRRPALVLGFGGFASGPGGVAACMAGVPLVIHEQNAVPGMTNRWLARMARRVLAAFPGAFPGRNDVQVVGNPVRSDIAALAAPAERYGEHDGPLRVLITGGSQGALSLNRTLPTLLASVWDQPLAIRHQAGRGRIGEAAAAWETAGREAEVVEFIDDMAAAWNWADLVICRAGALTVWEVAAAGVAAVFIPLPTAVDDHQTLNARWLADDDAARLLPQNELNEDGLSHALAGLDQRTALEAMAVRARDKAIPGSAARVAEICEEMVSD
jgi:UDP-N-acetylglucosamine--N-acetylmuramyl-(pentapeptide) pyrophosphoryl-undecaprenol N-acetylglucosamine transferase